MRVLGSSSRSITAPQAEATAATAAASPIVLCSSETTIAMDRKRTRRQKGGESCYEKNAGLGPFIRNEAVVIPHKFIKRLDKSALKTLASTLDLPSGQFWHIQMENMILFLTSSSSKYIVSFLHCETAYGANNFENKFYYILVVDTKTGKNMWESMCNSVSS
ncbi:hypothetical protein ZIOFF_064856 [Zingiber officinale]|uniref:Uncharacterized protein n=1 Tax=Zingiber officinale TaxID=94328 RepID=A0A8J5F0L4_ZINOF|nr:hypothetical protein ZIOFF_064856 [Zingiber officinale]